MPCQAAEGGPAPVAVPPPGEATPWGTGRPAVLSAPASPVGSAPPGMTFIEAGNTFATSTVTLNAADDVAAYDA